MGLLLQIIGVVILIVSLILGIMALNNSSLVYITLILLFLASGFIKTGRKKYREDIKK